MGNLSVYMMAMMAAVFWGANFNLAKPVVAEMGPYVAGSGRYILAAAIMFLIISVRKETIPLRHLRAYLILGVVGVFGFNLFFFLGMETTSAVNGALIMASNPLFTAVLAYVILRDRPSNLQMIAFPIGMAGVAIVVLGAGAQLKISAGDFYILIASLCWALYNVLVRKMMPKTVNGVVNTAGVMIFGAIALSLVAVIKEDSFAMPTPMTGVALVLMAVGGGVLAYFLWNTSIAKLGPSKTAIFMNLVPVTSMIIATIENIPPSHTQMLGAMLVISAVSISSLAQPKPKYC